MLYKENRQDPSQKTFAPSASGTQNASSNPLPALSLPKGGGAIRGIGEKFAANPVTGTGSLTIPIYTSPGRSGFGPQLSLSYDSGTGNGPFGFGWALTLPSITRKTDNGLPQYVNEEESDTFILSGVEDLVPLLIENNGQWIRDVSTNCAYGKQYNIYRYRPRVESLFARIERWVNLSDPQDTFWHTISKENITTWYGKAAKSRIADPTNPTRIFTWLICESYDDKGNVCIYQYKAENSEGVDLSQANERNRSDVTRSANHYLKHILYGNQTPYFPDLTTEAPILLPTNWCFELVFDYGEHDMQVPVPQETQPWNCRADPFSVYRATFEIRTYRLCQRVLMFHHFANEVGVGLNCLVRSTDFAFAPPMPLDRTSSCYTFLFSVTQTGYIRKTDGSYQSIALPPLEFTYSSAVINETVQEVDSVSLQNLPYGFDGSNYRWIDLDGEGVPGILTEQAGSWFYKPNLSPINGEAINGEQVMSAHFGAVELVARQPSLIAMSSARQALFDLTGDGRIDLVIFDGLTPGYFERTSDENWVPFRPFQFLPLLDWQNPNLRFIDLTGDGLMDILISEDEAFSWYASLGAKGFSAAQRVQQALDEEQAPKLMFSDRSESIFLADLSGDGLIDLVRIRNGEVCYWPNLGYGKFGTKISMDQAPWFEASDVFDCSRIQLADIDGSGTCDIVYFASKGIQVYFNQSGNVWSTARTLNTFPAVESVSSASILDLLGTGTACLVWSSPLERNERSPMRYIDLMGGQKPHLLIQAVNNLGAETRIHYAPSTRFSVADKLAGIPWVTRIPFPVHVVDQVETLDHVSGNHFVTHYAYHHGYYDGVEREFRGFGMVEQWDTETFAALAEDNVLSEAPNVDLSSHVPPILTRTWFHTGSFIGRDHSSNFFAGLLDADGKGEYYREPGLTDEEARQFLLDDTVLPVGLTINEEREACRALKGCMLRQEVYALDSTGNSAYPYGHPYTVVERNFTIRLLQPQGTNRSAVFFTHACEVISYHYERNPADPRIGHELTLETDMFGNVLKSAVVAYGRREKIRIRDEQGGVQEMPNPELNQLDPLDQTRQTRTLICYTENSVTNAIGTVGNYRTPLQAETHRYELTGYVATGPACRFQSSDFVKPDPYDNGRLIHVFDSEIPYEQQPTSGKQRRLIDQLRTLYRLNDLGVILNDSLALLPLGTVESLALPGETYRLALTPGLLTQVFQRNGQPLLPDHGNVLAVDVSSNVAADRGGYVDLDKNDHWWIPSGRVFLSPNSNDTAVHELTYARQHFFLPQRARDPFHTDAARTESLLTYDAYDLLILESQDQLGNRMTAGERLQDGSADSTRPGNDYRVLQPWRVMDPNRNRTQAVFDALGMVVAVAVMGKPEETLGDSLDGFVDDLTGTITLDHLQNPLVDPQAILGRATTRLVYDLFAYQRSKNQLEPQPVVIYTLSRETHDADLEPGQQTKIQHSFSYSDGFGREIQKKIQAEPGPLVAGGLSSSPRWVGSGWTIFNNKGGPVRQYEPFFDDTHQFKFNRIAGVSAILFYDPVGRVIATLHPNHTWEKVKFDAWRQESWDVNDTVTLEPQNDKDVKSFFLNVDTTSRLPVSDYLPTWYSQRQDGTMGQQEQDAARKAAIHAETPTIAHQDALGRTFLTVVHNRFRTSDTPTPTEEFYHTRSFFDLEGNLREVNDAKDRVVMRYDYTMLGTQIHQASMEAGEQWTLNDVAGKPISLWDSRKFIRRVTYDTLRRPIGLFVTENDVERLTERIVYGESQGDTNNHRTRVHQIFDGAGIVTNEIYDFKGNLQQSKRELLPNYRQAVNWLQNPEASDGTFTTRTQYSALDRPLAVTTPDNSVFRPMFNEANLLESVEVDLRGAGTATLFVTNIDYNARGQRTSIRYANGTETKYVYDDQMLLLIHLKTMRSAHLNGMASQLFTDTAVIQDLHYTYDPVGNITHVTDSAIPMIQYNNENVGPEADYIYDAVYRLISAHSREHIGQTALDFEPPDNNYRDYPFFGLHVSSNDPKAVRNYSETYHYDEVGNVKNIRHFALHGNWTRTYTYQESSLLETGKQSNRLTRTEIGNTSETYSYQDAQGNDVHGCMTSINLMRIAWGYKDQLQTVNLGGGGNAYYVYDASGQRVRKVIERQNGTKQQERIYLGGFEIYREYTGVGGTMPKLERETLHIMDDRQRLALVESQTIENGNPVNDPVLLQRYQFSNHLGSASVELDKDGALISYEEYHPYGTTALQTGRSTAEMSLKRYRYTGKERDEESGLDYHGARYYAPWLGRWTAVDPIGVAVSTNMFLYARNNPIKLTDSTGKYPDGPVMERWTEEQTKERVGALHKNWQRIEANRQRYASTRGEQIDTGLQSRGPNDYGEEVMQVGNAAMTLVNAFRDAEIRDRSPSVSSRLDSIIEIAQSEGLAGNLIMTFRKETIHGTGDTGFRREFQDLRMHPGSGDQVGHFLGAVRAAHTYSQSIGMAGMVAHEFERESYSNTALRLLVSNFAVTTEDYTNFVSGNLDRIPLDTTQFGVSYQDLYLTYFGLQFAEMVDQGRFANNEEAARYLEMLLTPVDFNTLPQDAFTEKFATEINDIKDKLSQFAITQTDEHRAWRLSELERRTKVENNELEIIGRFGLQRR